MTTAPTRLSPPQPNSTHRRRRTRYNSSATRQVSQTPSVSVSTPYDPLATHVQMIDRLTRRDSSGPRKILVRSDSPWPSLVQIPFSHPIPCGCVMAESSGRLIEPISDARVLSDFRKMSRFFPYLTRCLNLT